MTLFRDYPKPLMTPKTAEQERAEAVRSVVRASYNRRQPPPITLAGSVKPASVEPSGVNPEKAARLKRTPKWSW